MGGGFSFPRVSPNGSGVAVFELSNAAGLTGRVLILSRSGARMSVSPEYFNVFGLAWRGSEVWFTAADELPLFRNAIHAMTSDGATRVVARVPGNASLHDIAPDGRALIARTDDRSGISVLAPGEALERDLSWLDSPALADIAPDGRQILFTEMGVGAGPRYSVYLRPTDGAPAVRLSEGRALALSPDGTRAIVRRQGGPAAEVLPTGAGDSRRLDVPGLNILGARWLPDGRRVVARAEEQGRPARLYVLDADGGPPAPVTPESLRVGAFWSMSPEGTIVGLSTEQGIELHAVAGERVPQLVPGTSASSRIIGWIGAGILVSDDPYESGTVFRADPATGQRVVWKEMSQRDPTGIMNMSLGTLVVTPNGHSYGYGWHRAISDLYLVEGWA